MNLVNHSSYLGLKSLTLAMLFSSSVYCAPSSNFLLDTISSSLSYQSIILTTCIAILLGVVFSLKSEKEASKRKLEEQAERIKAVEKENKSIQSKLSNMEKIKDQQKEEIATLQKEITEKDSRIATLMKEKLDLNNALTSQKKESKIIKEDKKQLKEEREQFVNEVSNIKVELEKLRNIKSETETKFASLEKQVSSKTKEMDEQREKATNLSFQHKDQPNH